MEKTFVVNQPFDGFNGEISKYIYSLFLSISNVASYYIHYDGSNTKEDYEHVERVFAYELYHQWSDSSLIKNNKSLIVNAEIPKILINDARNANIPLMYPDLVLHQGQNDYKGNIIICEIKRASYARQHPEKVLDDLKKLAIYLSEDLKVKANKKDWDPFKVGVFVMTDSPDSIIPLSTENIKSCIENLLKEVKGIDNEVQKKIICVVYNGNILKYETLYNLIK